MNTSARPSPPGSTASSDTEQVPNFKQTTVETSWNATGEELPCPLCGSPEPTLLHSSKQKNLLRDYFLCPMCDLVFVPRAYHLDRVAERARYLTHNNDPDDKRYRDFLSRLWNELVPRLPHGSNGLDYGSGPGPALASMIREAGFSISLYDPFFAPDHALLDAGYDFITCTETVEHFAFPHREFDRLDKMLNPGGWLGIMTSIKGSWSGFAEWYYHRDETHLSFYSKKSMEWISDAYGWQAEFPRENVVLFQKLMEEPRDHEEIAADQTRP